MIDLIDDGKYELPEPRPIPWPDFVAEVLALYAPPMRARQTQEKLRHVLGLAEGLGATSTADLTPALIGRLLASRPAGQSTHTTHSLLRSLAAAAGYAVAAGYLGRNPFTYRKPSQWVRLEPARAKPHRSQAELARLLDLLGREAALRVGWAQWRSRRLLGLVATVAYTGVRRNEALYLQLGDVLLEERLILITARRRLKTIASAQPVPVCEALAEVLGDWLAHRLDHGRPDGPWLFPNTTLSTPWTGGPPGQRPIDRLKAAGLRAGIPGLTFQTLRRSWATHAEAWGLGPAMIQRVLRHTTVRISQQHYRFADVINMRAAVRDIEFRADP
jgi:integrase